MKHIGRQDERLDLFCRNRLQAVHVKQATPEFQIRRKYLVGIAFDQHVSRVREQRGQNGKSESVWWRLEHDGLILLHRICPPSLLVPGTLTRIEERPRVTH